MMRNVAIGAVLGFGLVVLLLSVFGVQPPAPLPEVAEAAVDAGPSLVPLNVAPVMVAPAQRAVRHPEISRGLAPAEQLKLLNNFKLVGADGGAAAGP